MSMSCGKVEQISHHVAILRVSYHHYTNRDLIDPKIDFNQAVAWLEQVPFALVSHGTESDPIFNYANQTALQLFGMTWDECTRMPSRLSAGPMDREERVRLLDHVLRDGYIDDYTGVRITADGRRFLICNATVWNLLDEARQFYGQAAMIPKWKVLQL